MKRWWYVLISLLILPSVKAQYYYSLDYELSNIVALLVGGDTPEIIWTRFLIWIILFAVLFNKATLKFFGAASKKIAFIVALAISILGVRFMPENLMNALTQYMGILLVAVVIAGIYWIVFWIRNKLLRHIIFTILCVITIFLVTPLSEIEPFDQILGIEVWSITLKGWILFVLLAAAVISLFTMGRDRVDILDEKLRRAEIEQRDADAKRMKWELKQAKKDRSIATAEYIGGGIGRALGKLYGRHKVGKEREKSKKTQEELRYLNGRLRELRSDLSSGYSEADKLHGQATRLGWNKTERGRPAYKAWYRQYSRNTHIQKQIKEIEDRIEQIR